MSISLSINSNCTSCKRCVMVCPAKIFSLGVDNKISTANEDSCIECGHCAAACAVSAIEHSLFPANAIHKTDYTQYPTPEQMMLLCKNRRSNRAFNDKPVPMEHLDTIVEAAHRAPTASNQQQVAFTVVTDPKYLKLITEYTLGEFSKTMKMLKNPLLKPIIKITMPGALRYIPIFERMVSEYAKGYDPVLRRAKAVILIHTPKTSMFGTMDANLAYQNGSLMAESLGVSQFYTGFVLSAITRDKKNSLAAQLGIDGTIHAGMALGMPAFRFPNYVDRKEIIIQKK